MGVASAEGLLRNLDGNTLDASLARVETKTFPLADRTGVLLEDSCNYPGLDSSGLSGNIIHAAEGIDAEARNEFRCLSTVGRTGKRMVEDTISFVHGTAFSAMDFRLLVEAGASLT